MGEAGASLRLALSGIKTLFPPNRCRSADPLTLRHHASMTSLLATGGGRTTEQATEADDSACDNNLLIAVEPR